MPEQTPVGLTSEFYQDTHKIKQWNAFLNKGKLTATPESLKEVCELLYQFLIPTIGTVNNGEVFAATWDADSQWIIRKDE